MSLRGEKLSTKDMDLIVESTRESEILRQAFFQLGFVLNDRRPDECQMLIDAAVLSKFDGPRIDLFVHSVCGKLVLSEGMKARSELDSVLGRLRLMICAREDIFLLKSVTERDKDLEDMYVLMQGGIDSRVVLDECDYQSRHDASGEGRIYEAFLLTKLTEIEDRFDVSIPWKRELKMLAERKLGAKLVLGRLVEGGATFSELSDGLDLPQSQVRAILRQLEEADEVEVDRSRRPYKINAKG